MIRINYSFKEINLMMQFFKLKKINFYYKNKFFNKIMTVSDVQMYLYYFNIFCLMLKQHKLSDFLINESIDDSKKSVNLNVKLNENLLNIKNCSVS